VLLSDFRKSVSTRPVVFLLAVNLLLLVVGCLMDQPIADRFIATVKVKSYKVLRSGTLATELLEDLWRSPTDKAYGLALQSVVPEAAGIPILRLRF
jgi:hypothetical protein